MTKLLDVITIGRAGVDLYGQQVGGRLEDMGSFSKYIGGSPTNIACGTARLGLKSGLITRVGDEHMGRFIREQLVREGVDVRGVATDPERLTALVREMAAGGEASRHQAPHRLSLQHLLTAAGSSPAASASTLIRTPWRRQRPSRHRRSGHPPSSCQAWSTTACTGTFGANSTRFRSALSWSSSCRRLAAIPRWRG